jgi:hypothetical protein
MTSTPTPDRAGTRTQAAVSSLDDILDEIAGLVTTARSMPMSSSAIVNRAEVLELVERARRAVPGELRAAEGLLSGADDVMATARRQAAALIEQARGRADQLVTKEQVVAEAEAKAAAILAEVEEQARALMKGADDYCDRKLAQFEIDLGQLLAQVQAGRERLAAKPERDAAG